MRNKSSHIKFAFLPCLSGKVIRVWLPYSFLCYNSTKLCRTKAILKVLYYLVLLLLNSIRLPSLHCISFSDHNKNPKNFQTNASPRHNGSSKQQWNLKIRFVYHKGQVGNNFCTQTVWHSCSSKIVDWARRRNVRATFYANVFALL